MSAFSVWAPAAGKVEVEVAGQRYPMSQESEDTDAGWWIAEVPDVTAGIDYGFRLDDGEPCLTRAPCGSRSASRA